ncbi:MULTISPECIES: Rv0361 family membrane protein [Tsukamurella]|uniref:DUF4878 domain-containing protein n=1 Tax=Tsukamurella strandjordii TaxID=147577 RepID=A0AA90SFJ8_9ACTN|nr:MULTISPECIES: hypothetical protein [Tsukamurella]MDP0396669.1 hypothetical protein [Tsukamurella strandjordii]GIZ96470.1 hypothetical protein TTY48_10820 [Tsukamurella sp. TY48]
MTPPSLTPEQNRRRWRLLLCGIAVITLVTVSLMAVAIWRGGSLLGPSAEAQIASTARSFAHAVDTRDQTTMLKLLCREEADQVTSDDDYDPDNSSAEVGLIPRPFQVQSVQVLNDVAAVEFSRSEPVSRGTLYLTKEDDTWKVCDVAKTRFE